MTREEIKDKFMKNRHINTQSSLYSCELVDEIFDDFEKRTCKNCKYLKIFTGGCAEDKAYYCDNCEGFIPCIDKLSCNDFKLKEVS